MQDYRKLLVWQKGHQLAIETYALPKYFLKPEAWPLRDQIFRAAISIPSNVAEGVRRGSNPDFARFLWHSMGSCNEFESDLRPALDVKLLPDVIHARLADQVSEVRRMLTGFKETLR